MFIAVYGFVTYSPYKDWSSWHCKCVKQSYFAVLVASSFQWNIPSQFEFRCSFFPECRTILLPMMAEQLESHMSKSEEMSMCADVLTDILDVLWQKEVVSPLFLSFLLFNTFYSLQHTVTFLSWCALFYRPSFSLQYRPLILCCLSFNTSYRVQHTVIFLSWCTLFYRLSFSLQYSPIQMTINSW